MCVDYVSTVRFTRIFRILSSKRNLSNQPDVPDGCVARTRRDSPARYTALLALFFSPLAVSLHRVWSWITSRVKLWDITRPRDLFCILAAVAT